MKFYTKLAVILLIVLIGVGCSNKELEQDVQRLQIENREMKRQMNDVITQLQATLAKLDTEIFPMGKSQSEMLLRLEKLESELKINMDKLDQNTYKISQISQQIADVRYRIQPGSSSGASSYSYSGSTPSTGSLTSRNYTTLSPNQIYQTAYADYLKGNYELAIQGFSEYLNRYSESELAPAVMYWLGECYYAKGDYRQAITEMDKLIVKYPKDDKVKNAALKKGFALFELNQTAQGVIIMQSIIREFPNSKQARIAKEKLESLGLKP
ncbi:MAG: tol-pal system protein YbgF [Acidobacteria bacterium]|nr:tol-pal system protein YbgF [Acidobacteriota bacterium]